MLDRNITKERIVRLALAVEHNKSYFRLLQGAIEGILTHMEEERHFLQDMMEESLGNKGSPISKEPCSG